MAVTHTFQIAKARAQLGYVPDKFSFADAVEPDMCSQQRGGLQAPPRGRPAAAARAVAVPCLLVLAPRFLGSQPSVL